LKEIASNEPCQVSPSISRLRANLHFFHRSETGVSADASADGDPKEIDRISQPTWSEPQLERRRRASGLLEYLAVLERNQGLSEKYAKQVPMELDDSPRSPLVSVFSLLESTA